MYRDGATWANNFGASLSGIYNATATQADDGRVHVGGMNASWYPIYNVYSGGALQDSYLLESADIADRVYCQIDILGNIWVLWSDWNEALPHVVNVTGSVGAILQSNGALTISGDSDSWGACAAGPLRVAWGGLDGSLDNQVWIEFIPDSFSAWQVL
jgi:hypothetical protein